MKGTFREVFEFYSIRDEEFDCVIGDVDMPATVVGDTDITFTDYCEEKYGDLLNAECKVIPDKTGRYTDSVIVDYPSAKKGKDFVLALAGYVGSSEWNRLFKEEENE